MKWRKSAMETTSKKRLRQVNRMNVSFLNYECSRRGFSAKQIIARLFWASLDDRHPHTLFEPKETQPTDWRLKICAKKRPAAAVSWVNSNDRLIFTFMTEAAAVEIKKKKNFANPGIKLSDAFFVCSSSHTQDIHVIYYSLTHHNPAKISPTSIWKEQKIFPSTSFTKMMMMLLLRTAGRCLTAWVWWKSSRNFITTFVDLDLLSL